MRIHTLNSEELGIDLARGLKHYQILHKSQELTIYNPVHILDIEYNPIKPTAVIALVQNLVNTSIDTIILKKSKINNELAIELAKNLLINQIQAIDLSNNQISSETQKLLKENYPRIKWTF